MKVIFLISKSSLRIETLLLWDFEQKFLKVAFVGLDCLFSPSSSALEPLANFH